MSTKIPLAKPWLTELEASRVSNAVRTGWLTQSGSEVALMEKSLFDFLAKRYDSEFSLTTCSNGTTALHLILSAIGISEGDEVIIPNFSYIAVANSVLYCNATPVLIDCESNNWNMNKNAIIQAITKKTKAVIYVDNYGFHEDLQDIRKIIPQHITLIRDAAESFPGRPNQEVSFRGADYVSFSFYANKVITCGEGGAVAGPKAGITKISKLKNQSLESSGSFIHTGIGYNYRISNMHAAVFNAQWSRKEEILRERDRVFSQYEEKLLDAKIAFRSNIKENPWLYTIAFEEQVDIKKIRKKLQEFGIETRPGFGLFSNHKYISDRSRIFDSVYNANNTSTRLLSLPTWPEISKDEIAEVVDAIRRIL